MFLVSSKLSKHSSTLVRSRGNKAAARTACLQVEMDYLEREAEYKKLLIKKEIAKAKAEEEIMLKIEKETPKKCPRTSHHETSSPDVKPEQPPKVEPDVINPLNVDGILNLKAPSFKPASMPIVSQVDHVGGEIPTQK